MRDFFEFASKYAMAIDHTEWTGVNQKTRKKWQTAGEKVQMHKVRSSDHRNASQKNEKGAGKV